MDILFIILIAIIFDILFGELPSRTHPVVLIGKFIDFLKRMLINHNNKISGIILTLISTVFFVITIHIIIEASKFDYLVFIATSSIILSTTFAIKGLLDSAEGVKKDLNHNIKKARFSASYLVSRDTSELSEEELVSATIESLTENIVDSVVSPLFYALIFGVEGAVTYRVINTLDSMIGYKDPENIKIGWFPARLDDLLNYIPARITAFLIIISTAILGWNWKNTYKIIKRDAHKTPSPNSGYPMAAAAGALGIKLKKPGCYELGDSLNPLNTNKIKTALLITKLTIILFIISIISSWIVFGIFAVTVKI